MSRGLSSSFFSLFLALSLALAASATPVVQVRDNLIHLPLAKKFNFTGSSTILARDQARVQLLRNRANARLNGTPLSSDAVISTPVDNQVVSYIATVGVGSPAKEFHLIVDTGSSNTWVGASGGFVETSTSVQTKDKVAVTYGSGDFSGTEFTDTVSLGPGLIITGQSIGVASKSEGFEGVDGIVGIGPTDLTLDTLSPDTRSTIPTVTDNLFTQGTISTKQVGVSFEPTNVEEIVNGELTFGGTDSSKFTGSITFTPITKTSPASEFFGINQVITYGTAGSEVLTSTAGIVDTGTTLTLISTDALSRYQRLTGAVLDNTTGLLRLTTAQFANLQSLFFTINGVKFEFTPNAQIWPRSLNTAIGGSANEIFLVVGSLGTPTGEGLDFINGQTWLERFYAVFDSSNNQVGFATTQFTDATSN